MSAEEYKRLQSSTMSPGMAAEYLKEGRIVLRTFGDALRGIYPEGDLQQRLIGEFLEDGSAEARRAAVKRVRAWLGGSAMPGSREDVFRIAFALGLGESGAGSLLGCCSDYGIHYRDGREIVMSWFLRNGRSYREALAFSAGLPEAPRPGHTPMGSKQVTNEVRASFMRVYTEEDLRQAYIENLPRFGEMHSRAYFYVEKYLKQLLSPAGPLDEREPDYSLETVMDLYLSMKMPMTRSRRGFTPVQRLIKQNWPNARVLRSIMQRKTDVPRKLILLLYVITENVIDDGYQELDEDYISKEERLEDHWITLNSILTDCGMPTLDPRNATDWLVLYSIAAEDEPMSQRMEQVIELLYADQRPEAEK